MSDVQRTEVKGGGRGGAGRKPKGRGRQGEREGRGRGGPDSSDSTKKGKAGRGSKGRGRSSNNKSGRGGRGENKPLKPTPEELEKERQLEEERQRKAAEEKERKRIEEEELKKIEKRKAELKSLEEKMRGSIETVQQFTDVIQQRQASRNKISSLAEAREGFEADKKKLKTDLKKCTTFVKKIRSGAVWTNSNVNNNEVLKDVSNLNLSRYVDEIVSAILESKPKVGDLPVLLTLCQEMHLRYSEFLPNLVPAMWNFINGKNDPENAKARRIYLRAVTELHLSGLQVDVKAIEKCIADATGAKDGTYSVQDANLLVSFAKAASPDIFGVTPRSVSTSLRFIAEQVEERRLLTEKESFDEPTEKVMVLPPLVVSGSLESEASRKKEVADDIIKNTKNSWTTTEKTAHRNLAEYSRGAYEMLSTSLVQTHIKLQKLENRCEQDRLLAGSLTDAREKGLTDARKLKETLEKSLETLSDILDLPLPKLPENEIADTGQSNGTGVEVWTKSDEDGADDYGPFDDEETKAFYYDVPDLLTTVPPALLGMSPESIEKKKEENLLKYGDSQAEIEGSEIVSIEITPTSEAQLDADEEGTVDDSQPQSGSKEEETGEEANKDTPHYRLMVLLEQELPECNRREHIDEISERFCTNHGQSKNSKKRLIKTLFSVPRSRLDLLPYYSRLTSTLDRVWGEVGLALVAELEQQFHGQTKYKKNLNIESRMKTARYIGELTKFRVAPPIVFLRCMKRCLDDFTGNNVDIACMLMESCGRYLYRLPHTSSRIYELMESMTRLGKAKNLDERLQSSIKAAFYSVKPPARGPRKKSKAYPPLEAYLRYLLFSNLAPSNSSCSFVAKQIARLPWHDPSEDCGSLVCRLMLKAARKGRYKTIQSIAILAGNLRTQRAAGEATVRLIDAVLEELRWAIEQPMFKDQQRTLIYARLLGELCCASQVSAEVILTQLYDLINLGHEIPELLREASRKLLSDESQKAESDAAQFPVYNSSAGIAQTVKENEEMEEEPLETKEEADEKPKPIAVSDFSKFDPRVPSPKDPPNSAYRIKLICTLLEVSGKQLASRNTLARLKGFLTAFQRYLFTKTILPTDVEFSLLDTFDILDSHWRRSSSKNSKTSELKESGFPRYASWLDAHNATVAIEESEALFEQQQRAKLASGLGQTREDDDSSSSEGDEEDDVSSFSGKESLSDTNEVAIVDVETPNEVEDDDLSKTDGSTDSREDEDIDDGAEDKLDEEAYLRQLEEEEFERELRRVTMEALEKGKSTSRKLVADTMPSGSHSIKKKPSDSDSKQADLAYSMPTSSKPKAGVSFQLLRKGTKGKVEAKELIVPMDNKLALVATKQDDQAARERDEIKQRVLQYEAESAEAEYSGGNVYLEQEKLQVIRNRPLSMDDIDRNFGTRGGNLRPADKPGGRAASRPPVSGRGGRGRGRSSSGRTLFG